MSEPVRPKPDALYEPPRFATWMLRRALPKGVRGDTILGALIEEWNARASPERANDRASRRVARAAATFWYWRQALGVAARYAWRHGCRRKWKAAQKTRRILRG